MAKSKARARTTAAPKRKARKASRTVPLSGVTITQVRPYDRGAARKIAERDFTPEEIAAALEFYGRMRFCRYPDQITALGTPSGTIEPLRGLVQVLRDGALSHLDGDAVQLIAEILEDLTVRLEIATQPAERHIERYRVTVPPSEVA